MIQFITVFNFSYFENSQKRDKIILKKKHIHWFTLLVIRRKKTFNKEKKLSLYENEKKQKTNCGLQNKHIREKIANFAYGWKVKTMLLYNITLESWTKRVYWRLNANLPLKIKKK